MAAKGVTSQVAVAAGVAAATGAAQLGLGYGLGVVVWPVTPTGDDSVWLGSLGWATWIAASSTVFGAMIAAALRGQPGRLSGPVRLTLAFAAGIGALLTVALVALPARSAVRQDALPPQTTAALYALIGVVLGIAIAYWAVVSGPVAANLIGTSAYLWTLAATAIVVELTGGRPAATYLTSWQFAPLGEDQRYGTIYWPSALITVFAAFLLGVIAAAPAVKRGELSVGTALSGAVGPLLVAAAFLLLAPQLTGVVGQLQSAYLIAPYAVLAGLAGSALVVSRGQRSADQPPDQSDGAPAAAGAATRRTASEEQRSRRFGRTPRPRGERTGDEAAAVPAPAKPTSTKPTPAKPTPAKPTPFQPPRTSPAPADKTGAASESSDWDRAAPESSDRGAAAPASADRAAPEPAKPSFTDRLRRDRGRTQDDVETAELKLPRKSTVTAPPSSPPIAKINPSSDKP